VTRAPTPLVSPLRCWGDAAYLPDGTVATTTGGRMVTVWDTSDGTDLVRLESDDTWADETRSIAVDPDGALLAAAETSDAARVWDLTDRSEVLSKCPGGRVAWPAFSPTAPASPSAPRRRRTSTRTASRGTVMTASAQRWCDHSASRA
jgi:WD40 repeat protein